MSKYLIGIDLGTTNTVVYYLDRDEEEALPRIFEIEQLVEFGESVKSDSLPSFIYLPDEKEIPEDGLNLPWDSEIDYTIGKFAQKTAPNSPMKVVSSAKSWLCVDSIDRTKPVLPWNRQNEEKQLSPVEASRRIIEYIKDAWNYEMASENEDYRIENQSVVLTVPASFDAAARELTVNAAEDAGLAVTLLEEPQAAIYSWLLETGEEWRKQVSPDDVILVCDIGGGTTDLSLIKVTDESGNLQLERIAVGKHILLGGDNMDLAAAYTAANKIKADKKINLDAYQITGLTHACREAKESLLSEDGDDSRKLTVLGKGSSLIANTITTEIYKSDLERIVIDGFFPECSLDDRPAKQSAKAGLKTFGLDYESDPAVTKHLAEFLSTHCQTPESLPNCILFNGGVTKSNIIRGRIKSVVGSWLPEEKGEVKILTGNNPDMAVALGASYFGQVKDGKGIRIKAGSSHSYYLGIESSMPAVPGFTPPVQGLCVLPLGTEEGTKLDIDYSGLGLIVGEKTEFKFYSSVSRKEDVAGLVIDDVAICEDIEDMTPVVTELSAIDNTPSGSLVPVKLTCELTEIGTLEVWCESINSDKKWKLNFELRENS